MKKVLITAGGTREYIDDVRVLTNISSGALASRIADVFLESETHRENKDGYFEIYFIYTKGTVMPHIEDVYYHEIHYIEVSDVASVMKTMEELVPQMDIVIHCMAVSDFGFKPISTKLKSSDPDAFIESMKERIYQTPKILSHIKKWNPNCFLVSFKFEVGVANEELINISVKSMKENSCDLVVANDKAEMIKEGEHIAYILERRGGGDSPIIHKVSGKIPIAEKLLEIVSEKINI